MSVMDPIGDPESPEFKLSQRGGRGSGGTGVGGGGGFTSFTGGGGFFGGLGGGGAWGANAFRNPHRRMSQMGGMEVNDRAPSDTVPAWLTPGEFVVNDESAQMFGPELERMNAIGNAMRMDRRFANRVEGGGMNPFGPIPLTGISGGGASGGGTGGSTGGGSTGGGEDDGPPRSFAYGGHVGHGYNMGGRVNPFDDADGYAFGGWLKKNWSWALPLALAGGAVALPALMGGGAAAGGAAAGGGIMGEVAPGVSAATGLAGPSMRTLSPLAKMGGLSGIARGSMPYANAAMDMRAQGQEQEDGQRNAALDYYMSRRQSSARGYAMGGPVGPFGGSVSGLSNKQTMWGGANRNPFGRSVQAPQSPGMSTQSNAQDPFTLPGLTGGARGGMSYDPRGFVGTYDPRNPWAHRTQNLNPGAFGDLHRQVGQFGAAGYYGPGGSPQVRQALREQAMGDARAFGEQAYLSADVSGMDPAAAAAFRTQALSNAGRGVADQMTRYAADQALADQAYGRDQFGRMIALEDTQIGREQDYRNAQALGKKK